MASGGAADPSSWNRYAYVEGDPVNFNDPLGLIAQKVCDAQYSSDECSALDYGPTTGNSLGGGMYCDQGSLPFITSGAECSAWSSMVWHGVPSDFAQGKLPVVIGAGGVSVITGGSVSIGSIISGVGAILGGIGIGEWIYQRSRGNISHDRIKEEARERARKDNLDYCDALQAMYNEARSSGGPKIPGLALLRRGVVLRHTREAEKIKQQKKTDGCRRSRGGR